MNRSDDEANKRRRCQIATLLSPGIQLNRRGDRPPGKGETEGRFNLVPAPPFQHRDEGSRSHCLQWAGVTREPAMVTQPITIDLPQSLVELLQARAEQSERSLQDELV